MVTAACRYLRHSHATSSDGGAGGDRRLSEGPALYIYEVTVPYARAGQLAKTRL